MIMSRPIQRPAIEKHPSKRSLAHSKRSKDDGQLRDMVGMVVDPDSMTTITSDAALLLPCSSRRCSIGSDITLDTAVKKGESGDVANGNVFNPEDIIVLKMTVAELQTELQIQKSRANKLEGLYQESQEKVASLEYENDSLTRRMDKNEQTLSNRLNEEMERSNRLEGQVEMLETGLALLQRENKRHKKVIQALMDTEFVTAARGDAADADALNAHDASPPPGVSALDASEISDKSRRINSLIAFEKPDFTRRHSHADLITERDGQENAVKENSLRRSFMDTIRDSFKFGPLSETKSVVSEQQDRDDEVFASQTEFQPETIKMSTSKKTSGWGFSRQPTERTASTSSSTNSLLSYSGSEANRSFRRSAPPASEMESSDSLTNSHRSKETYAKLRKSAPASTGMGYDTLLKDDFSGEISNFGRRFSEEGDVLNYYLDDSKGDAFGFR